MSHDTPHASDRDPVDALPLIERVRDRVAKAGRTLDHSASHPDHKSTESNPAHLGMPVEGSSANAHAQREARSLKRVYRELRSTYRRHRRVTGQPAEPALREAVHAFKRGPSLPSLVSVASFLDERRLLTW